MLGQATMACRRRCVHNRPQQPLFCSTYSSLLVTLDMCVESSGKAPDERVIEGVDDRIGRRAEDGSTFVERS